ncbi:MAG: tRNA lysidine(34) synthetase TilS [candidate division Zixibacteria bacterium]|nr:tRNA lysidine(34) synthetase TilS [candidate division Zixibacteria bacterium]
MVSKKASRKPVDQDQPAAVLVALSGGPDSVALLHLLVEKAKAEGGRVYAAHVNYRLRGAESEQDERFCRELCKRLKVRLFVRRLRAGELAKGNLQARARRIRYEFFDAMCRKHEIDAIAIGHNKSDNVETLLMNLGRGAGTFGLGGIRKRTGKIIRPLLEWTRGEIEAYLGKHQLAHRVDSSNLTENYLRNRVRRRVLPVLREVLGAQSISAFDRSARVLAEHEEYLRQIGEEILVRESTRTAFGKIVLDLTKLRAYHPLVRRIVLALCFERMSGSLQDFDFEATERFLRVLERGEGRVDLKRGLVAEVCNERVYLHHAKSAVAPKPLAVKRSGTSKLAEYGISLRLSSATAWRRNERIPRGDGCSELIDADALKGRLTVRTMRAGDRFRPLGLNGDKKLSDFFIDRKVDRPVREEIPLLLAGRKIIWVIGQALADEVKVTDKTERVIKLEVASYRGL